MEKFECLKTSQYIVAIAIVDMMDMQSELIECLGQEDCDMFAEWMLSILDIETAEKIAKDYAYRVIGEKIQELKGI